MDSLTNDLSSLQSSDKEAADKVIHLEPIIKRGSEDLRPAQTLLQFFRSLSPQLLAIEDSPMHASSDEPRGAIGLSSDRTKWGYGDRGDEICCMQMVSAPSLGASLDTWAPGNQLYELIR